MAGQQLADLGSLSLGSLGSLGLRKCCSELRSLLCKGGCKGVGLAEVRTALLLQWEPGRLQARAYRMGIITTFPRDTLRSEELKEPILSIKMPTRACLTAFAGVCIGRLYLFCVCIHMMQR